MQLQRLKGKDQNFCQNPRQKILAREQELLKSSSPEEFKDHILPKDTLLFHFTIYHPLYGTKTQEIVMHEGQTLIELSQNILCLVKEINGLFFLFLN
jgi:hypothetical protein